MSPIAARVDSMRKLGRGDELIAKIMAAPHGARRVMRDNVDDRRDGRVSFLVDMHAISK